MKKNYLYFAVLFAALFTSCSQDDHLDLVSGDNAPFTGVIESIGSRTVLNDENSVIWEVEDQISIFKKSNRNRLYSVSAIDGNGKATFEYKSNSLKGDLIDNLSANYAVYPWSDDNDIAQDGDITAPIANTYTFETKAKSIESALMVAKSNDQSFHFTNAQALFRLSLFADIPEDWGKVQSFTLTSNSVNLSGTAIMDWDGTTTPVARINDGEKSLTVELANPADLPEKGSNAPSLDIYVPIVPATFPANDLTLSIKCKNGTHTVQVPIPFSIARKEIRGIEYTIGPDDFDGTIEDVETTVSTAEELISVLQAGGDVVLAENLELNEDVVIPTGVTSTIDLNDKKLELSGNSISVKGNLEVNNGDVVVSAGEYDLDYGFDVQNGGSLNIAEGVNLTANEGGAATICMIGGELNVNGTITATATNSYGIFAMGNNSITVNGTINAGDGYAINQQGGELDVYVAEGATLGVSMLGASGVMNLTYHEDSDNETNKPEVENDGTSVELNIVAIVPDATGLGTAVSAGVTEVQLEAGNYILPSACQGKVLTISGTGNTEEVKVDVTKVGTDGENCDYGLDGSTVTFDGITILDAAPEVLAQDGSTVTFDGITITTNSSTYIGYARCNGTYNNCTINGTYTLYGNSKFNKCTFNVSGDVYNIWTWGAPEAAFTECIFNCDGKAILLYGQANTKLTMSDCTFNDNGGLSDLKAAIEIGNDYGKRYELIVDNATVNGFAINDKGINTGTTLWANKNSMGTDKLNVIVDGVDVY